MRNGHENEFDSWERCKKRERETSKSKLLFILSHLSHSMSMPQIAVRHIKSDVCVRLISVNCIASNAKFHEKHFLMNNSCLCMTNIAFLEL